MRGSADNIQGQKLEEARLRNGYTQKEIAQLIGKTESFVSDIFNGRRDISDDLAFDLEGIGMGEAEEWVKLRLEKRRREEAPDREARAMLRDFQCNAAVSRGWFSKHSKPQAQLEEMNRFLGDMERLVNFRARNPGKASVLWLAQVQRLARARKLPKYNPARREEMFQAVVALMGRHDGIEQVRDVLAGYGVALVILRQLPTMLVDGALVRVDDNPVIALTLRYDRIDWFWFTLVHEAAHLKHDHKGVRLDVVGDFSDDEEEREANQTTQNALVPPDEFEAFVRRSNNRFSAASVEYFAKTINRHPGIVTGRLQRENLIPWSYLRALLVPVREKLKPYMSDDKETA